MKELEEIETIRRIRSIPFALRLAGIAFLINLIPLGMAFHAYDSGMDAQQVSGSNFNPIPQVEGSFGEKFAKMVEYLVHPDQREEALGLKIFLITIPLGLVIMIIGFARGPLRYLNPLLTGLAIAIAFNHALLLLLWEKPGSISPGWLIATSIIGLIIFAWGAFKTIMQSVLLRTCLHLVSATFLSIIVTLLFPLILCGMAIYLNKKRDIPYSAFFAESGNFYNFLIMNIYPVCFQIIPTIQMVRHKGKKEARQTKRKYRKTETPRYHTELDFDKLEVGDVLLSGMPSWLNSPPIQASNILSCDEEFRFWSHAFVYAGSRPDANGDPSAPKRNIVEAQSNGKGVQEIDMLTGEKVIYDTKSETGELVVKSFTEEELRSFNYDESGNRKKFSKEEVEKFSDREKELCFEKSYFENGYYLMALRPKYIDKETREKVVEFCRRKDGEGYGYDTWGVTFYSLCALIPPMLSGWLESDMAERIFNVEDAYFCSELVADAYLREDQQVFDRKPWRVKPLDFRMNPLFEEVECGYRRVPVNESAKKEVADQVAVFKEQEQKAREMAETSITDAEKAKLETIAEKFRLAGIRTEMGLYPEAPLTA